MKVNSVVLSRERGILERDLLMMSVSLALILCWSCVRISPSFAQESYGDQFPPDLTEIGIRQLLELDLVVTSPGKKPQALSDVAAAVYVITAEDIASSPATHVTELLKVVPGLNVARVSSNKWAISSRGFNQVFAHRLLVLQDGVSVFSPTTNGVYWETLDIPLHTIERIEVIRGPGAALWGANAVNGVINIITKTAQTSEGSVVEAGGGADENLITLAHGGEFAPDAPYRVFTKYASYNSNKLSNGESALDNWSSLSMGGRIDGELSNDHRLTFSGDMHWISENSLPVSPSSAPPFSTEEFRDDSAGWRGGKSLLLWDNKISEDSEIQTQIDFVLEDREADLVSFDYQKYSAEIQHRYRMSPDVEGLYGLSYRLFSNDSSGSPAHVVSPSNRSTDLFTAFLQAEIDGVMDRVKLTFGSKFEHNDHTGFEYMPNARILFRPFERLSLWSAVSRAITSPAVYFEDVRLPLVVVPLEGQPFPGIVELVGNRDVGSEKLTSFELGVRLEATTDLYFDLVGFYGDYRNVFGQTEGEPYFDPGYFLGGGPALVIPYDFSNNYSVDSYGSELAIKYTPASDVSLTLAHTLLMIDANLEYGVDQFGAQSLEESAPENQVSLEANYALTSQAKIGARYRYVDNVAFGHIDAFHELDARLSFRATPRLEFSVIGRNLLNDSRIQFQGNLFGPPRTEIERSIMLLARVNF